MLFLSEGLNVPVRSRNGPEREFVWARPLDMSVALASRRQTCQEINVSLMYDINR